jgi:uncharacterized protein (DUF3084 family)
MGTLLVLSSLIAICGFIAYTGDLLGRRLGKRRLTVFGLRPRHTAILCTVITGMVIAGTTLAVLLGVSAGVRRAVTQGEALVLQNEEFRVQQDGLLRETARLQRQIAPLRQQNATLAQSNQSMEEANQSLRAQNCTLADKEQSLLKEKTQTQRELRATSAQRESVERELKLVRHRLQVTGARLGQSRRDLEENGKLIQKKEAVLARLEAHERDIRSRLDVLALRDMKVREGEELARVTVPAASSTSETLARIQTLLARARQVARDRGAKRKGAHLEAYFRNSQLVHMLGPSVDWWNVSERDAVQLLVKLVSDSEYDVVLRAQVVQNTAETEPIPFDINAYWNVLAFRKGEEIASTTIDPSLSSGQILEQLAMLLRTKVRKASIEHQMIPGARNELGEVHYDPLLEVAEKVKRLGVPAKVGVVAAREVRSADPLEIDFYVVPADKAVAARAAQVTDGER